MRTGSALLVLGAMCLVPSTRASAAESGCDRFGEGVVAGHVRNARVTEASGLAASRRHPGVYWTHNDSGGRPEVFALKPDGTDLGSYAFAGARAVDWEDIAVGPKYGVTGSFIYAADIGDNAAEPFFSGKAKPRGFVTVYRAPEPSVAPRAPGAALTSVERFNLTYPDGSEDAEALFVDPVTGDLVIITKSPLGLSRLLMAPASSMVDGATITMDDYGTIRIPSIVNSYSSYPGTFVTGADISADGSLILVRTYQSVLAFSRATGESVVAAIRRGPCIAPQIVEKQGEGIAIASDMSRYVTLSEGVYSPINVFSIAAEQPVDPTTRNVTTTIVAPRTTFPGRLLARAGSDKTRVLLAAGVITAGFLVLRIRRRPERS